MRRGGSGPAPGLNGILARPEPRPWEVPLFRDDVGHPSRGPSREGPPLGLAAGQATVVLLNGGPLLPGIPNSFGGAAEAKHPGRLDPVPAPLSDRGRPLVVGGSVRGSFSYVKN